MLTLFPTWSKSALPSKNNLVKFPYLRFENMAPNFFNTPPSRRAGGLYPLESELSDSLFNVRQQTYE
jgi:hypothetical protein